jgi:hypothetical protein
MPKIQLTLPPKLFRELQAGAAAMQQPGYGPVRFATDLLASELASRRLPKVGPGRCGARIAAAEMEL